MKRPVFQSTMGAILNLYLDRLEASLSERTFNRQAHFLRTFDLFLYNSGYSGGTITQADIAEWTMSLSSMCNNTISKCQGVVFGFLHFADAFGFHSVTPNVRRMDYSYSPHIFTNDERSSIHDAADNFQVPQRKIYPWIQAELPMALRIMDSCGTRVGETLLLQIKDVNFEIGVLSISHAKGNRERLVPMNPLLTEILEKYCYRLGIICNPNAFVFPGKTKDTSLPTWIMRDYFARLLHTAGIPVHREKKGMRGVCLHCERHTFICRSLEHLISINIPESDAHPYLSTYVGHTDLYSTEHYLQYPTERLTEEISHFESHVSTIYNAPIFQADIEQWEK